MHRESVKTSIIVDCSLLEHNVLHNPSINDKITLLLQYVSAYIFTYKMYYILKIKNDRYRYNI